MAATDPFKQDPHLLDHFRAGRPDALERVYRAYLRPLRRFVVRGFAFRSEGRDLFFRGALTRHVLEDVLQETFRRAFGTRARAAYDGVRPYKNYLFTIARNAVMNELLAAKRQVPVGDVFSRDHQPDDVLGLDAWTRSQQGDDTPGPSPVEAEVERLEINSILATFVETLDVDETRFFTLRFLELRSQEQTAQVLGWNRARVRKLETRLRGALVLELQGTGYLDRHPELRRVRRTHAAADQQLQRARSLWRASSSERTIDLLTAA